MGHAEVSLRVGLRQSTPGRRWHRLLRGHSRWPVCRDHQLRGELSVRSGRRDAARVDRTRGRGCGDAPGLFPLRGPVPMPAAAGSVRAAVVAAGKCSGWGFRASFRQMEKGRIPPKRPASPQGRGRRWDLTYVERVREWPDLSTKGVGEGRGNNDGTSCILAGGIGGSALCSEDPI